MNIFVDQNQLQPYFLEMDKDHEITWEFGPISVIEMFSIRNEAAKESDNFKAMVGYLRHSLKGAKGIEVPLEEVEIPMLGKKQVVSMEFIAKLKPDIFVELATQAYKINTISEQDSKN